MQHYDVLYNQLHTFRYSYRSFLIDFSIAELQVVNISEDTHVNHPWLRLRRVLSRLSPLRGGPLRDPAQGRTFLSLYHWFQSEERKVLTHTLTLLALALSSIDFTAQNQPTCSWKGSIRKKKRETKKERAKDRGKRLQWWSMSRNKAVSTKD